MQRVERLSAVACFTAGLAMLAIDLAFLSCARIGDLTTSYSLTFHAVVFVSLSAVVVTAYRQATTGSAVALLSLAVAIGFVIDLALATDFLLLPAAGFAVVTGIVALAGSSATRSARVSAGASGED